MNEAWPDIFYEGYIQINFKLNPLTKFNSSSRSIELKRYPTMDYLSNDHKDHPYQHKKIHELCDETGYPIVNFMESQWKLRQQHDQNFPMEGKQL